MELYSAFFLDIDNKCCLFNYGTMIVNTWNGSGCNQRLLYVNQPAGSIKSFVDKSVHATKKMVGYRCFVEAKLYSSYS